MQRARSNVTLTVSVALLGATALFSGCLRSSSNCQDDGVDCPATGGSGGTGANAAGTAGKGGGGQGGSSGSAQGGSTSGDAGQPGGGTEVAGGGTTGGEGGTGGMVSLPCDGACAAPKPICDELNDTCVQCLKEQDCTTAAKKKCDTATKACVECLAPVDCPSATAAKCVAGACAKCTTNDDCSHIAGKGVCDVAAGECVECTGKDYASCGMDAGTPLVCDSILRACTKNKEHTAAACSACVSDAQCRLGHVCARETYKGSELGYACFWKEGDTANGAPADCFNDGRPYSQVLADVKSIDGQTVDICSLSTSTCTAVGQFKTKNCKPDTLPDDSLCGFAPPMDSKCDQVGISANYRCSMTCGSAEDCPGSVSCVGFVCDI
jgi:hypothetical protein